MEDGYPDMIIQSQAQNAWQTGPIALECCGYTANWAPTDGPRAFQWALDNHASLVHIKSAPLPSQWLTGYQDMIRSLGYRLVIRRLTHPQAAHSGGQLTVELELDNIGVAPCYFDYRLAVKLTSPGETRTLLSDCTIKHLLPGLHQVNLDLPIPSGLPPDDYELAVGVVDPGDSLPVVRLAIEGRDPDGWYPLSNLAVF